MKKILQTIKQRKCRGGAISNLLLKLCLLLTVLVGGNSSAWGVGIKRDLLTFDAVAQDYKGQWNAETKVMSWTLGHSNLFTSTALSGDYSNYDKIVLKTSNLTSGPYRVVITAGGKDYTCSISNTGTIELPLYGNNTQFVNNSEKLTKELTKNITQIRIGGNSNSGNVTISEAYLYREVAWDDNGNITFNTNDFSVGKGVSRNGNTFTFNGQYNGITLKVDGIKASDLQSITDNITNDNANHYTCFKAGETTYWSLQEAKNANATITEYLICANQQGSFTFTGSTFRDNKIRVHFNVNGGQGSVETKIWDGVNPIQLPSATPTSNNAFVGWAAGADGSNPFIGYAGDNYTPTGNITLYAHYATFSGNADQGTGYLGDFRKMVKSNTIFTPAYEIEKDKQIEFTFKSYRVKSLTDFWLGWIMWAKPSTANDNNIANPPFYFWTNAQDTRYADDESTNIWKNSVGSNVQISVDGKLRNMTSDERDQYRADMGAGAEVSVKVSYFNNTIRMNAVIRKDSRTYVQAYTYKNATYINNAAKIKVYFSVDHAFIEEFKKNAAVSMATATYNITGSGTITMATPEGVAIEKESKVAQGDQIVYTASPAYGYKFKDWGSSGITTLSRTVTVTETHISQGNVGPYATFVEDNGPKTIEVSHVNNGVTYKNNRTYYIYIPKNAMDKMNSGTKVPVVFSLHGRGNNADPFTKDENGNLRDGGKPVFNSIADAEGFIVVYPQGRTGNAQYNGYEAGWNRGFSWDCTGWEATGKENGDTEFLKQLVAKIKSDYPKADADRFYIAGFSMGGMMTYASSKVLNGTFAAYASTGGFPLNEFHLNLATANPVPFYHVHGKNDGYVAYKHLETIKHNMTARNACNAEATVTTTDQYTQTKYTSTLSQNGKNADLEYIEVNGLGHEVHGATPQGMWDFFKNKSKANLVNTTLEYKWDMSYINNHLTNAQTGDILGWHKDITDANNRYLSYGDHRFVQCTTNECPSGANPNCNGNHNVYPSIQLTSGKHTLYVKANVTKNDTKEGYVSMTLKNNLTGEEVLARKLVNKEGQSAVEMNMLYEFDATEGEYTLINKRSHIGSQCLLLEIHRGSYRPANVTDQSLDNATLNITDGILAKLDFENVTVHQMPAKSTGAALTSDDGNMKLYVKARLVDDGFYSFDQSKYIHYDPVFGNYFQNIPDADIYDRTDGVDFMRVILGSKNSLAGHDGIRGIHETKQLTIGFWVNANIAVSKGLEYSEPSIFYLAGDTYNGTNSNNPHMFNIKCDGSVTGWLGENHTLNYNQPNGFGSLCHTESKSAYYKNNFYNDRNWHYITFQQYANNGRLLYNMYVDGEPTVLDGWGPEFGNAITEETVNQLKSIVLGGANASNVKWANDVAFAYDDIVIYNRILSKREIQEIIRAKNYTPSVWDFKVNLSSKVYFDPDKIDNTIWEHNATDNTYTLKLRYDVAAPLTYDGIHDIPSFVGLQFKAGTNQITIDAKTGELKLKQGVTMYMNDMAAGNYVRIEHKPGDLNWNDKTTGIALRVALPASDSDCDRTGFKVSENSGTLTNCSFTMPADITIKDIFVTNKYFAEIRFVDKNNTASIVKSVVNPANENALPRMDLYVNNVERLHNGGSTSEYNFKYSSSAPHVASVNATTGVVTLNNVAGSATITAELINTNRKWDHDVHDPYNFDSTDRIFSSYEIVVTPKENTSYVIQDNEQYVVGQTLYNNNKTIGVTLGGWTYNNGNYYEKFDSYSEKQEYTGQKFEKNENRIGYLANSRRTEENIFEEIFTSGSKKSFSTNGAEPAKSEQLKVDGESTYAGTGNYAAPTNNKSVANATPWVLPCRGSHIKVEPTAAGIISVYVKQEGCVTHVPAGQTMTIDGITYNEDEPIDVTVKRVYIADEKGEIVKEVVADTKSKAAAQIWKDDGRSRAEYLWGDSELAYNEATKESFLKINNYSDQWSFLDNWPNPGMQQHVFKLGNDNDGHVLITTSIVRYTFNVLPGKTYYIFSNKSKLGLAGFTFEEGKHGNFEQVQVDKKHKEWKANATNPLKNVTIPQTVNLVDGTDYQSQTVADANVKLTRNFFKGQWNAICLPYSINNRQMKEQFGEETKVVLMNNISETDKRVHFIEHVNQDLIAGYPYLILPKGNTKQNDENGRIENNTIKWITTRATLGEASSPLFTVGTDGETYVSDMQSDALVFKGTFTNTTITEGSYVVANSGILSRIPQNMNIKPYRSYIYFNKQTSGAKAIMLSDMSFDDFENGEGTPTAIEDILFEDGILTRSSDIYSINGQKVRSKAGNMYNLPKGVYIVNGKKYVNK